MTLHMDVPTLTNSGGLLLVCALLAFALSGLRDVSATAEPAQLREAK